MLRWHGAVRCEGRGPFHYPAEWKGMGPVCCPCNSHPSRSSHPAVHRLHSSPTHPSAIRLLLGILFICGLLGTTVSASVRTSPQCPLGPCWDQFEKANNALLHKEGLGQDSDRGAGSAGGAGGGGGSAVPENEARCTVLRTYLNCITSTKNSSRGCHGDINFNSVRSGVRNQLRQYRCAIDGPTLDFTEPATPEPPHQCRYHTKDFRVCGMFGDPHLRTFGADFQTCKVKGAWPLVNNQHLIVQVTNDPVEGGASDATATSKLTVIVKSHPECGSDQYHTYQAQTDDLPSSFDDGNTSHGPHASLQLVELEPNKHVEIHIRYIATTVIVRQIGRYFTFAIRMPDTIVNTSRSTSEPELCTKGCPPSERIDYRQFLTQRRDTVMKYRTSGARSMAQADAEELCRAEGLVGFYFDSCVFDLMATGDRNFTMAALHSLRDVLRLDPAINITDSSVLTGHPNSAPDALWRTQSWWRHVLCACVLLVTLWQKGLMAHR